MSDPNSRICRNLKEANCQPLMHFHYLHTPIGFWEVVSSGVGIRSLRMLRRKEERMEPGPDEICLKAVDQLSLYFKGELQKFDLPIDLTGHTSFQIEVWNCIKMIPHGKTRSYQQIADLIGKPGASRAVGMANRQNPVPIIIPCHRVIGSDGKLTGYYYGLEVKAYLLGLENPTEHGLQAELFSIV